MQIDDVPLKYLTAEQASEYKKIRAEYQKGYKTNQKLFQRMYSFSEIASKQAADMLIKSYFGKYYRDVRKTRFVAVTGADSDTTLKCTMISKSQDKDTRPKFFSVTYNTSFGISMLQRDENEWVSITANEFEKELKAGIKDMQNWKPE